MKQQVKGTDAVVEVERSVSAAYDALITADFAKLESDVLPQLESAMATLQRLCDGALGPHPSGESNLGPRLWLLRKQVLLVEAMLRQCLAFQQAAAQERVPEAVSYSPKGFELAV